MTNHKEVGSTGSRRSLLKGSAALVAGGVLGGAMTAYKAMSPLCHTSVTKWTLAAGVKVNSKQKKERCAKVAGEVAYTTALAINEYFDPN